MRYRVVGWTDWDNNEIECADSSAAACNAIIDCIRENGFYFTGFFHREWRYCTPVLNDGKKRSFSRYFWGELMANAQGFFELDDYLDYVIRPYQDQGIVLPDICDRFNPKQFVPETDLHECFEIRVCKDTLDSAFETGEIRLDDLECFRYVEVGDTFVLRCEGKEYAFVVTTLSRRREVDVEDLIRRMDNALNDIVDHCERKKSPIYLFVELKPIS